MSLRKTPYPDGTTHVIFEPANFIAKLAALVPKPRVNLTRYNGIFAPYIRYRAQVTPAKRGKGNMTHTPDETPERPLGKRRAVMTWAQRLRRVFNIDVEICRGCGGALRVIASIEDAEVIKKILDHLNEKETFAAAGLLPESRAPPQSDLFEQ